ncbi:MAG: hypothetical protein ACOZB3_10720 [Calditrichota bacterium]
MNRLVIIFIFLGLSAIASAQPDSLWSHSFGGSGYERCYDIVAGLDGGYVLAGYTTSYGSGSNDGWLLKISENGDSLWSRTFGGDRYDVFQSIITTSDNHYVIVGLTASYGAGYPTYNGFWMMKTTMNGDSVWSRVFGGTWTDECYAVQETADGGFILAGGTKSYASPPNQKFDVWLLRTDANGDSLWSRNYLTANTELARDIVLADDGGFFIAGGKSNSANYSNGWLIRTDSLGNIIWDTEVGGATSESFNSVVATPDGGCLAGGTYPSTISYDDMWLVKFDADGDTLWTRTYGGSSFDQCNAVLQAGDGYIAAGYFTNTGYDFGLLKVDLNGDSVWRKDFLTADVSESGYAVMQAENSGYVMGGQGAYDLFVLKTTADCVAPIAPTDLTASTDRCDAVELNWTDNSNNELGFIIERDAANLDTVLANVTTYLDNSTVPGQSYSYSMRSYTCDVSIASNTEVGYHETLPSAIALAAADTVCDTVELVWTISANTDSIRLHRNDELWITLSASTEFYLDTPTSGGPYAYYIVTSNQCGTSLDTAAAEVQVYLTPEVIASPVAAAPQCDHIEVTWSRPAGSIEIYRIYRGGILFDSLTNPDPTVTYSDYDIVIGVEYSYQVTAVNPACGETPLSPITAATAWSTQPPAAPEIVITSGSSDATIRWNPITETLDGCPLSAGYLIYFAELETGPYWFLAFTTDTFHVHHDVVTYTDMMFYQVETIVQTASLLRLNDLSNTVGVCLSREEVHQLLNR